MPVVVAPNIGFLVAGCLILLGLVFYYPFVYRKIELSFVSKCSFPLKCLVTQELFLLYFEDKINSSLKMFFHLQKAQVVLWCSQYFHLANFFFVLCTFILWVYIPVEICAAIDYFDIQYRRRVRKNQPSSRSHDMNILPKDDTWLDYERDKIRHFSTHDRWYPAVGRDSHSLKQHNGW